MHWNCLALSLWLLTPHFQNICSPFTITHTPLQPYESFHDCLVCLHFNDGEFENLVKLMIDLSLKNKNWGNHYICIHFQTHEWWMPHNYSEVLPALLALLVSYDWMIVFDDLGLNDLSLTLWPIKMFSKISSLFCLLMIFLSFGATFGSTLPFECTYIYPEEVV